MSRDPFTDIPEDVDDDFLDEAGITYENNDSGQMNLEAAPEEKTVEEVTKGTPPKDIFGKLIKFLIPAVAVLLGIWFLMPQEHRKPKEREEVAVDQRVQEANANSMLKELQESSEEKAALRKEAEQERINETPSIPVVDGNGNVTGKSNDQKDVLSEQELRESEIRGSQLEALGNFNLFGEEGIISKTGSLLGIGVSPADEAVAAHQRMTEESLNRSRQIEERRERNELLNSLRNPNEKFQQSQPQGDYVNETVHQQVSAAKTLVQQGTVVRTVLLSAVNSDMPGAITAMVTSDVYDSTYGRSLMIPKGSKLIGSYNSNVAIGQDRVMIAMTRMILPDGTWISLAATPATDRIGQSGLEADVNNHFWRMFGASFMIGAASMLLPDDQNTISTANINGTGDLSAGSVAAMALVETVQTLMERNKHIAPTLTINPGTEFSFLVVKDMVMTPYQR